MTEEERNNLRVGSSDFISLNSLKTFILSSSVSEVLMVKNQDNSSYSLSTHVLSDMTHVLVDSTDVLVDSSDVLSDTSDVLIDSSDVLTDSSEGLLNLSEELSDLSEELDDSTEESSNSSEDLINSTFSGDFIEYKYNAAGQKISKFVSSVNTNNTVKLVEYLDGF